MAYVGEIPILNSMFINYSDFETLGSISGLFLLDFVSFLLVLGKLA